MNGITSYPNKKSLRESLPTITNPVGLQEKGLEDIIMLPVWDLHPLT